MSAAEVIEPAPLTGRAPSLEAIGMTKIFGPLRALFDFYDAAEERGIRLYGGGQFELGPGRGQIQYLASLFSPDAPNDVAPGGYNAVEPADGLPVSPLEPVPAPVGFRRQ